jgi:hypothetical protein
MKTNELTGAALDWAVAKCEGGHIGVANNGVFFDASNGEGFTSFNPSTDPSQAYPIILRECIATGKSWGSWKAFTETSEGEGPTPLVAAMRCYVASKLGDTVDVPDELTGEIK